MGVRRFVEIDMFVSYPRKLVFPQFDHFPCGIMAGISFAINCLMMFSLVPGTKENHQRDERFRGQDS